MPEVIEHGRTGIIVDHYREMPAAIEEADSSTRSRAAATSRSASRPNGWWRTTCARTARSSSSQYPRDLGALRRSPHDREILRLAVLALGALAAQPTFVLVDTAIVGHLGTPQLAALGIAGLILGGVFAIFNFLAYGTTSQVTRAAGAGERETADRLGAQAFWLSLAIGTAVSIALGLAAEPIVEADGRRRADGRVRGRLPADRGDRAAVRVPRCSAVRATSAASPTCARRS